MDLPGSTEARSQATAELVAFLLEFTWPSEWSSSHRLHFPDSIIGIGSLVIKSLLGILQFVGTQVCALELSLCVSVGRLGNLEEHVKNR